MTIHLANRDVAFAVISHAPFAEIEVFQKRMGWKFPWVSSFAATSTLTTRFRRVRRGGTSPGPLQLRDDGVPSAERPGLSVFFKDASGHVFPHILDLRARLDILVGTYNFLDVAPKGRDEAGLQAHHGLGSPSRQVHRGLHRRSKPGLRAAGGGQDRDQKAPNAATSNCFAAFPPTPTCRRAKHRWTRRRRAKISLRPQFCFIIPS